MERRTIILSKETADLLECKRMLDECYNKIGKTHDSMFCSNPQFEDDLNDSYGTLNRLIIGMLADQIDHKSSESHYKVI